MPTDAAAGDLVLRPAGPEDLPGVAEVNLRARAAAHPAMPRGVHTDDEVRAWVAGWDLTTYDVWLAVDPDGPGPDQRLLGYARFDDIWLDDLYVDPADQRRGIGGALLDVVKAHRPAGFSLWVFESNGPARGFYLRHGLTEAEHTDGSGNEEREPDLRMVWGQPSSG